MSSSTTITVNNKNKFSTDGIWLLRALLFIQIIFVGLLATFMVLQFVKEPKPVYFPIKKADQLIDSVPLDQKTLTEAELLNWVTEAIIVSFSFNYHNYTKITDKVESYFDKFGMESYIDLLRKDENVQKIVLNKLIVSGRPISAPRIIKEQIINDVYACAVELELNLKFRNQIFSSSKDLILTLLVLRVPETVSPVGVKIVKIESKLKL